MPIKYVERALVAAAMAGAGYLFAVSATTADGVGLRAEVLSDIGLAQRNVVALQERRTLIQELEQASDVIIAESGYVNEEQEASLHQLGMAAGTRPVEGHGLEVTLDDARNVVPELVDDVDSNLLVVHERQIEAVINALWAGGAQGVAINGKRLSANSQIRCAGNTVILNGLVFSPAYRITAVGDPDSLKAALLADEEVQLFRRLAWRLGLKYSEVRVESFMMDAVEVPPRLEHVHSSHINGDDVAVGDTF